MIQPYNKLVSKGVCFLGTFQKYIFEILELIFHVILPFPKGVPFEVMRCILGVSKFLKLIACISALFFKKYILIKSGNTLVIL
ncbi:hypothetical protein B5P40_00055 [Bacillus sp. SRB_8]|nr:hypothetical protein B5P40_00055 [Bacillus sp. SRB_8]